MATKTIKSNYYMPGDTITFGNSPVFFGYVGSGSGNFYVFLPKAVSSSVTNISASYSGQFGWLMINNRPLVDNATITGASSAGGNLLSITFSTSYVTSSYFELMALNVPNLTITFS